MARTYAKSKAKKTSAPAFQLRWLWSPWWTKRGREQSKEAFKDFPWWGWVFVAAIIACAVFLRG